ncbi:glycerol dehydrogenase [Halopiger thermotolerans]
MARQFAAPPHYVQGRDVLDELGEHVSPLGDRAVLLADDIVLDIVEERATESLGRAGVDVVVEEFGGEASPEEIDRVANVCRDADADVIVGAGGGKALDTAKAARQIAGGAAVSLPTIASTDAPTSALSVVYTEDGEFEEYRFYDRHPDAVIVDTGIIAGAPTRLFRSGIADALATWFEASAVDRADAANVIGGEPTDAALELARLAYDTLREQARPAVEAVEVDAVTDGVESVVEANTLLSGLGFESGGLAAAHSIHNGLTQLEATHDATHGEKVNIGTLSQLVLEGREGAFVEEFVDFSLDVGLPVTLAEIGLEDPDPDQLETVAEAACADDETIHNEPFDVDPAAVRDAIRTADAIGRRMKASRE